MIRQAKAFALTLVLYPFLACAIAAGIVWLVPVPMSVALLMGIFAAAILVPFFYRLLLGSNDDDTSLHEGIGHAVLNDRRSESSSNDECD